MIDVVRGDAAKLGAFPILRHPSAVYACISLRVRLLQSLANIRHCQQDGIEGEGDDKAAETLNQIGGNACHCG